MKRIIFLVLSFIFFLIVSARSQVFKSSGMQNAGYSVYAIDAETGRVIFETPQVSLVPASVMKVITTAAALEILGPDFRFHTQVGYNGQIVAEKGLLDGDLVLRGGCDPAFYSEYFSEYYKGTFESWAKALDRKGIRSINGDLIVDLSNFDGFSVPGGWVWEDIGNYYGAGVSSLSYSDNLYRIHFSSAGDSGKPVTISSISPAIDSLRLINKVLSANSNRDLTVVYGAPGSFSQIIEGTIPKGASDFVVKASIPDPARCAAIEFIKVLKSSGIKLSGKILTVSHLKESDFNPIAEKESPVLRELIVPLNHESLNLFAEHLLLEIGRARKGVPDLAVSVAALKEFWTEKKVFIDGFYPTDGSGLSRSNGICSRTLAEVLRYMYLGSNRDYYFNSLPVAGKSGTLQYAFKGTKLENNLCAKTGSMTRVRSLAGIFANASGKAVIFSIITNNFEGTQTETGHSIEELINELYTLDATPAGPGK